MIDVPDFKIETSDWVEGNKLWGKKLAKAIRARLGEQIESGAGQPGLAALIVGDDPASQIYVKNKEKAATKAGFYSEVKKLPAEATQEQVLAQVEEWNNDPKIHGILVQLPLPKHLDDSLILQTIDPAKDADGFHISNVGRLFSKQRGVVACTPLGVMVMLQQLGEELKGKNAVVLGRSNIVGKPMAQLLLDAGNCTVTVCHSKTENINEIVAKADILISAMGVRGVIDGSFISDHCIVVDVGMHRLDDGLAGDLDTAQYADRVRYYTPVPGGVGPLTIAMLLYNTYNNFRELQK